MTPTPMRRCTTPGCPRLTDGGACPVHFRAYQPRRRKLAPAAVYNGDWPRRRLDYLLRHPRCVLCSRMSEVPDHHPRSRRQLIAAGITDPDADRYLRPLCKRCHNAQTGHNQPGGFVSHRF